jgi:hypothetical protein
MYVYFVGGKGVRAASEFAHKQILISGINISYASFYLQFSFFQRL